MFQTYSLHEFRFFGLLNFVKHGHGNAQQSFSKLHVKRSAVIHLP